MASKKKSSKKKAARKPAAKKKIVKKQKPAKKAAPRKPAKKQPAKKKAPLQKKAALARLARRRTDREEQFQPESSTSRRGVLSGDLQGVAHSQGADSESVDELLEEGNAFEAGIVSGVEEADESGVSEVHTREVPEDDVPEEYLEDE